MADALPMNLVFLGPPGAGKGTQAKTFAAHRGVPHVSTGDMFRAAAAAGTPLGVQAKEFMDKGVLVPDSVVCGVVRERLAKPDCGAGFILDGFPRTTPQALDLEQALSASKKAPITCVDFRIDRGELLERLTARLTCRKCGAVYNKTTNPPKKAGTCDVCGGETYTRDDDKAETVAKRQTEYDQKTAPLLQFYEGRKQLRILDASGTPADVARRLEALFPGT
jgi:adenylate kinase